eukprot:CAMPEP_0179107742 /NCGR_PEP_ID=MMETSP0796-20121207/50157_1 /TAXON_ID=73915 /ORGANISM="Pyrodinium bahamense, Strain pbaha01" /LENGTH=208 /DNA_ID=CAMNT_0020805803 /DNA_START=1176 /DNA_END=1801 /DNA_ORIENTATION=-
MDYGPRPVQPPLKGSLPAHHRRVPSPLSPQEDAAEAPRPWVRCRTAQPKEERHSQASDDSSEDEADEPIMAADFYKKASRDRKHLEANKAGQGLQRAILEGRLEASTASSTPVEPCLVSPLVLPTSGLAEALPLRRDVDYRNLSETELRDELGDLGSSFTCSWDREELIGVLEQMDRIVALCSERAHPAAAEGVGARPPARHLIPSVP